MTNIPDARPRDVDIEAGLDLCDFIDASPSPFHACAEMARRLRAEGFVEFLERDVWTVEAGTAGYVIRDGGTIIAFRVGSEAMAEAGFRLVGAHSDSPTFRVRPNPLVSRVGYGQVSVEVYGGPLAYTWLDRDLGLAGRVVTADGEVHLVHVDEPLLRIPSLAIHLNRELNEKGLQLNPQQHVVPMFAAAADDLKLVGPVG